MSRLDLRARGLRTPMHTGLIQMTKQRLFPFMAAPIRPMETLIGCRVDMDAYFNKMVKLGIHIPIGFEWSMWLVPLSALGEEFQDLAVGDAEDSIRQAIATLRDSGQNVPTPGAESSQGHLSGTALGTTPRHWAGEIGDAAVGGQPAAADSYYARYVSEATYAVARTYYDLEPEDTDPQTTGAGGFRTNPSMMDNPPAVADMIRGALYSGVTAGGTEALPDQEPTNFASSVSSWAEVLSLMSAPNRTYGEYLESFGVDLSTVQSLPEPYILKRGWLKPRGGVQSWNWGANWSSAIGNADDADAARFIVNAFEHDDIEGNWISNMVGTQASPPDLGVVFAGDRAGISKLGKSWRVKRKRRLIAKEPSVLIGLAAWWPMMSREYQFAHHLDLTHMIRPGHWGVPTGGLDESDFLMAQGVSNVASDSTEEDEDQGELSGLRAYNMLNLYLNGDSFCNSIDAFYQFGPGENFSRYGDANENTWVVNASAAVQLAVATDMVQ
jgi:hypothetical protein